MATNLFVRSLDFGVTDEDLKKHFETVGTVVSAKVIAERDTNRSKGFGFVEMGSDEEAAKAIKELDGKELNGRAIYVSEARPKADRP